jgi:hypothetical protein
MDNISDYNIVRFPQRWGLVDPGSVVLILAGIAAVWHLQKMAAAQAKALSPPQR